MGREVKEAVKLYYYNNTVKPSYIFNLIVDKIYSMQKSKKNRKQIRAYGECLGSQRRRRT